jgi:hypothetical protein
MSKKPTPIDTAAIESATRFDASIFLGTGRYHTATFDNLADAREAARQFAEVAKNGRKGMVYAVPAEGRSIFVPASYQPATKPEGLTEMSTVSAIQIAQLTAIITGGGFKRANSKAAAEARFIKVATEAGIKNAADIVKGPYDMAEHVIREHQAGRHMTIPEVQAMRADETTEQAAQAETGKAPKAAKPAGKRAEIIAAAQRGELPAAPDFSAETHKRFRPKLARLVEMAEKGDVEGLKAEAINPVSSSPKAMAKYRDLAVMAIEARSLGGWPWVAPDRGTRR